MSRWQEVINIARQVRNNFHDDEQPLKETFEKICKSKNIEISYAPCGEHACQEANGGKIVLPLDTSRARDNFTVAHELGHIYLNHRPDDNGVFRRSGKSTQEEIEANLFAAEFLMPKDKFTEAAQKFDFDENSLANEFEVSKTAALVRMSALKLRPQS